MTVFAATVSTMVMPTVGHSALRENAVVAKVFDQPVYRAELRHDAQLGGATSDLQFKILGPVLQEYRIAFQQIFEPRNYELQAAYDHLNALHSDYLESQSMAISERLALIENQLSQPELASGARENLLAKRAELVASLDPPNLDQVWNLVAYWKFQRHLYDVYGGGRVVIEDYGPEAIDAMSNWLYLRETEGDFTITDPDLREAFYESWTERSQALGVFSSELIHHDDQERAESNDGESALIAQELRYDQNRYRLLNPGWMRALYKSIIDAPRGDAAVMIDLP